MGHTQLMLLAVAIIIAGLFSISQWNKIADQQEFQNMMDIKRELGIFAVDAQHFRNMDSTFVNVPTRMWAHNSTLNGTYSIVSVTPSFVQIRGASTLSPSVVFTLSVWSDSMYINYNY